MDLLFIRKMFERKKIEHLFRRHYAGMKHLAMTLVGDDDDAEDIVQDVFARLMELDVMPAADKSEAYLMSAVRNGCYNLMRRAGVKEQVRNLWPVDAIDGGTLSEWQDECLEAIQMFVDSRLTEPHRTIFRMRFDDDMTLKEIAAKLDMNINTVYKYLVQSIQRVRNEVRPRKS